MTGEALDLCVMLVRGWIQPYPPAQMPAMVADWLPAVDMTLRKIEEGR